MSGLDALAWVLAAALGLVVLAALLFVGVFIVVAIRTIDRRPNA